MGIGVWGMGVWRMETWECGEWNRESMREWVYESVGNGSMGVWGMGTKPRWYVECTTSF